jgi:hypothetical protein
MKLAPSYSFCCNETISPQNPELYGFFLNSSPKTRPKFSIVKLIFTDLVILISLVSAGLGERAGLRVKMGVFAAVRLGV